MPGPATARGRTRPLHLAAAIDAPGVYQADHFTALARLAERGCLDFVTLDDSLAPPAPGVPRLDALAVLARVAPRTGRVGLVPTVTTTHTEPFHLSTQVATLDWVSRGRAGWTVQVSATEAEAAHFGRRPAEPADALWREAAEVADVVTRLWDSWEDDAEIRDTATARFIDRDKLHHVDFEGERFTVRGPSIVPRPPQGHPLIAVDATDPAPRALAADRADVAYVRTDDPGTAASLRAELRHRAAESGRDPDRLTVLASLRVDLVDPADAVRLAARIGDWFRDGAADGFHLRPTDPPRDLARLADATVPLLQQRGLLRRFYTGDTLRDHLCLPRPANRYAPSRQAAR
ncbi:MULTISPECIES: LLM class flavin-dependent oxidoreductase [Streptomycetaceae]|uniref:Nitrilotriacetate monooxygenase protein n=1 Tax=Streptantibioticus cattleyicolor (strain ATCC 35852 / DSM 46488 / JCM 4925 / NBRC 14057 / NRRL 8057) TaxID=1003195 RepID=F8JX31_STREN|nr:MULTISPECIES: LLM class flavin-dependent oxidoreductase [Streptomycetaceae]AEW93303.1 nitrilotriacetate monooxygenase protein [Streptantibioticus cattleyicolor NRRL 8057 = DSM 46488]MYS58022.1 LLM class flavin-dependent oxidoreductase [Streptomyces sp. SID5468]CCB73663.1 putative FMNH2-utilizing oxygenase [Streptantibioticus cattleyicolor NRRL 8057 = DSM 46488]